MTFTLTINTPKNAIEGWTGFLTDPRSGEKVRLVSYCGGGAVAFNTKDALVKEARRVAKGLR